MLTILRIILAVLLPPLGGDSGRATVARPYRHFGFTLHSEPSRVRHSIAG